VQHVQSDGARIRRLLKRVEGKVEWGFGSRSRESGACKDVEPSGHERHGISREKTRHAGDQPHASARGASAADRVYKSMSRSSPPRSGARAWNGRRRVSRLLLDAAFLVPAGKEPRVSIGGSVEQTRGLRALGIAVSLTGPWPPYNFIE
jgi:hypothetical protein